MSGSVLLVVLYLVSWITLFVLFVPLSTLPLLNGCLRVNSVWWGLIIAGGLFLLYVVVGVWLTDGFNEVWEWKG